MECKTALFFLPLQSELPPEEAVALQEHLAVCPDCDALARAALREDAHLGRAMRDVPVPLGLKGRLLDKLAAGRTALFRQWAVRILQPLTALAALLLIISLALMYFDQRRTIDPEVVVATENHTRLRDAQEANQALARLGFAASAPDFVKYSYLTGQPGRSSLPGYPDRQVPVFHFLLREGGHPKQAVVIYVVKANHLEAIDPVDTGDWKAEVHPPNPSPGSWCYLVLHTGPNWDWLREFHDN